MKNKKKNSKVALVQSTKLTDTAIGKYLLSIAVLMLLLIVSFFELLSPEIIINAMDVLTQDYFWASFVETQLQENPSMLELVRFP